MTSSPVSSPTLRRRLALLLVAALAACGAAVLPASTAWAGQVATTPTVITIVPSTTHAAVGAPATVQVTVAIPDGTPPDGVLVIDQTDGSASQQLRSKRIVGPYQTIASAGVDTGSAGDQRISAHFSPTRSIEQSSADASATIVVRYSGASLTFSPGTIVAGRGGTAQVGVDLPQGAQGADGTVRLDVGTTEAVATCAPQPDSGTSEACTLRLPASLTAGDQPMNLTWYGSPTTDEADLTGTLHVVAESTAVAGGSGGTTAGSPAGAGGPGATTGGSATGGGASRGASTPTATTAAAGASPSAPTTIAPVAAQPSTLDSLRSTDPTGLIPLALAASALVLLIVAAIVLVVAGRARRRRDLTPGASPAKGR